MIVMHVVNPYDYSGLMEILLIRLDYITHLSLLACSCHFIGVNSSLATTLDVRS